jgi:hypothetical protein
LTHLQQQLESKCQFQGFRVVPEQSKQTFIERHKKLLWFSQPL